MPTIATTITPMKNSVRPTDSEASAIDPTSTSDITPTATPAIASMITDGAGRPADAVCSSSYSGLKMSRWVFKEKRSPAT